MQTLGRTLSRNPLSQNLPWDRLLPSRFETMFSAPPFLVLLSCLLTPALGATYSQTDSYQGSDFLSGFVHQAIADPTHGRV